MAWRKASGCFMVAPLNSKRDRQAGARGRRAVARDLQRQGIVMLALIQPQRATPGVGRRPGPIAVVGGRWWLIEPCPGPPGVVCVAGRNATYFPGAGGPQTQLLTWWRGGT